MSVSVTSLGDLSRLSDPEVTRRLAKLQEQQTELDTKIEAAGGIDKIRENQRATALAAEAAAKAQTDAEAAKEAAVAEGQKIVADAQAHADDIVASTTAIEDHARKAMEVAGAAVQEAQAKADAIVAERKNVEALAKAAEELAHRLRNLVTT